MAIFVSNLVPVDTWIACLLLSVSQGIEYLPYSPPQREQLLLKKQGSKYGLFSLAFLIPSHVYFTTLSFFPFTHCCYETTFYITRKNRHPFYMSSYIPKASFDLKGFFFVGKYVYLLHVFCLSRGQNRFDGRAKEVSLFAVRQILII